ncbi:MAG: tetratricopeptide repeat protein, partial [Solirubrobacterales bacterium]|nr:tetratricopeptide repeat protein [Solirubrobacterales bacterium]
PVLLQRLVTALRRCGRPQEAIARANEGLTRFPGFTDMVFDLALASLALNREDDAIGYWKRCIEMGDAPARFGGSLGAGTYLPRISMAEVHARRGELEQAETLLDWCISEHPNVVGVIAPYASTLLRSGTPAEDVAEKIEESVPELTPAARHVLATTFFTHGAMAAAENQFRAVLEARPTSAEVRVQLAEILLNQRNYTEAAVEASQIADDDPFAGLACRVELWSLIASGNIEAAHAATARATRAGVPAAELEVFTGWAEIETAGAAPDVQSRKLPAAGVPLLGVILETLLSAHEFDTFEKLTNLLTNSSLPQREQRELLANMYLEHGFLQSAAIEWMAVCETNPDTRALVGLARIAKANGQLEDATVFATEALKQDPTSAGAREILAAA